MNNKRFFLAGLLILAPASSTAQQPPIIDMHLHAYTEIAGGATADWAAAPEARSLTYAADVEAHMQATLADMDRYNVVLGVVSGPEAAVRAWHEAAPGRVIGGATLGGDGLPEHSVDSLRALVKGGVLGVLGELGLQYHGILPDDPRLEPYYQAAEELRLPVALHTGLGPPGASHTFAPRFRAALGKPGLFEPVLVRHPDLRAYLMHAGWPYIEETVAMMYSFPDLYADIGVLAWALPRPAFHAALKSLFEAGLGDRILFGTDQMLWPRALGLAVGAVESVPFLSEQEKRNILYNNAARFLELDERQIARHYGR